MLSRLAFKVLSAVIFFAVILFKCEMAFACNNEVLLVKFTPLPTTNDLHVPYNQVKPDLAKPFCTHFI